MKTLGWITAWGTAVVVSSIWSGYALSILWAWFIASQFEGAPHLSIPGAIGLALVVRYLTYDTKFDPKKDDRDQAKKLVYAIFMGLAWPLFGLAFGYIVRGFL